MLSQVFFVGLVVVVAALMAVDLVRTRGETSHGHAERQAYGADRVVAAPSRTRVASAFSPEPVRGMAAVTTPAPAPAAAAAPAPAPPRRQAEAPPGVFDQPNRELPRSAVSDGDRVNSTFVSLSHRSQSLVERQLRLIEDLERGEQDGRRLASLSRLNRIAVRIYRNSQNLLILAGHQASPVWNQPVRLAQLVRAALAEVEDYERVSADVQADVAVRGPAVNDLVHLLVELIENATSFSAAEMPVHIKGQILASGGALLDVTDRGIGMTPKEMAYANQQLDNPPAGNIDVPKWMGLLVVGRLAARHGIRIRLNQPEYGGLTALVWLPDEILSPYSAAADPGLAAAGQRTVADGSTAFSAPRAPVADAPATQRDPAWSARTPQATLQAEPPAARLTGLARPEAPSADHNVVVPHAESQARARGLPIFDEVESRWSRNGAEASGPADLAAAAGPADLAAAAGPADGGLPRRPPAAAQGPRTVPATSPGLPGRPGAAGSEGFSGFQRSAGQGRTSPAEETSPGGQDQSLRCAAVAFPRS
jgi:hypothetical protein